LLFFDVDINFLIEDAHVQPSWLDLGVFIFEYFLKGVNCMYQEPLTIDELAKKLKVKKSWIYRKTQETGPDAIPRLKFGKYLRFDYEAVMQWLESRQVAGGPNGDG
jgi:excisionase family DNA binding protein